MVCVPTMETGPTARTEAIRHASFDRNGMFFALKAIYLPAHLHASRLGHAISHDTFSGQYKKGVLTAGL